MNDGTTSQGFAPLPRLLGVLLALAGKRVAFFHIEAGWRRELLSGKAVFPHRLAAMLNARGYRISFLPYRRRPWPRKIWGRTLHIYLGRAEGHRGPGCLVLHPGYVQGYWYLDPKGHRERSSIVGRSYDASQISAGAANLFFAETRRATVKGGWTTRAQPTRGVQALPSNAILIALQKIPQGRLPLGAVCTEIEMVRAVVAARADRPVLIKFHPFGAHADTAAVVEEMARADPNVHLVDANIHDLLGVTDVLCCYSSGTGFEAMLHRAPTVLFATADFHHVATKVKDLADVPLALERALSRKVNYPKYVYWFQSENMWHAEQQGLEARLDALLTECSASLVV